MKWWRNGRWFAGALIAAFMLVTCMALSPTVDSPLSADPPWQAENESPTRDVSQADEVPASVADSESGGSASDEPECVSDVVLVEVADALTIDEVNAQLAELDYIATDALSEDDLVFGYAELALAEGVEVEDAMRLLRSEEFASAVQPNYVYHLLDVDEGSAAASTASSLQPIAEVNFDSAEMSAQSTSVNDPQAASQWALEAVNAYNAWDYARANGSVTVAVLDSGVNVNHEDLKDRIVGAYSVLQANKGGDTSDVSDALGHGTHVAGIIGATTNNGKGVSGVSYNANIMPVQVIEYPYVNKKGETTNRVTSLDAAAGIRHIISVAKNYNVRVLNLSFGTASNYETLGGDDRAFLNALESAHNAGLLVVYASGNGGSSGAYKCFPSDFDSEGIGVINVTRSGDTYVRSPTSNYNSASLYDQGAIKELSAPGGTTNDQILSTVSSSNTSYDTKYGTSMAAPYVSGVAALVFAANSDKTAKEVKQVLIDTAQDLNTSANIVGMGQFDLQTGYGMVDAEAAVKASAAYLSDGDTLMVGGALQLSVQKGDGLSWTWASSDPSVATVDSSGKVVGKAAGEATVTAKLSNSATLYRTVYVYDATILGDTTIEYGALSALGVSSANPSSSWVWSSADTGVASVGATSGQVIARGVGQTTITVHLNGNPDIAGTATITVTKADLANATLSGVEDQVYAGEAVALPNLAVYMPDYTQYAPPFYYYDTRKLTDGTGASSGDYEVSYANNDGKGTATVTVTAKGSSNYKGSQSATFNIGDGNVANATITYTRSYTYTGSPITVPDLKVVASTGELLTENENYQVVYPDDHTSAGYASLEIKGIGGYVGSVTKSIYIAPVSIASESVSLSGIVDKSYTGSAITQSPTLRYNGMTLVEGADYSIDYSSNTNAGTAAMRIRGLGNYATYNGWSPVYRYETFTISPRAVTITASSKSKAYDGTALTATTAGYTASGLVKSADLSSVTLSGSITNVGSATASVSGYTFASGMAGNYSVTTKTGTLRVTQASLSGASVTLSPSSCVYDGTAKTPSVTVKVGSRTLTQGVDYTASYSNNTAVGTATVTVVGRGNYVGSKSAAFSIAKGAIAWKRLYGTTALDTMKAIVEAGGWAQGGAVVLATVGGYYDGLTANGVAGLANAPIVMTDGQSLSPQARSVISTLRPQSIIVCGGSRAVSDSVASAARAAAGTSPKVTRLWGRNADDTAVAIYRQGASVAGGSWSATAFVCTDVGYWDALSAAPISYAKHMPIFLTTGRGASLSSDTLSAMRAGGVSSVYVVGGESAVAPAVVSQLKAAGITVSGRLYGRTAVDTSSAVARFGLSAGISMSVVNMGIATTSGYWDALAGAALCGKKGSVIVLVDGPSASTISGFVNPNSASIATGYVFGGTSAVSAATYNALPK